MKAWIVTDEYDEYSTVVFAETQNKAKTIAQATDCCEDMDYINIKPRRFKEADARYCGKSEIEWNDPADRRFLVEHGWACVEVLDFQIALTAPQKIYALDTTTIYEM